MNLRMVSDLIKPKRFERASLPAEFQQDAKFIELSDSNINFLACLLEHFKPQNILECGVAAGGSSEVFLYLLDKLNLDGQLYSVDLNHKWYRDGNLDTGWAAKKHYKDKDNWHLITGKFLPEVIEKINVKFDLCFLDTVHSLPGELLDFLVVLPFMRANGVIAMHDTMLHILQKDSSYSNRILMDVCVGDKIYPPQDTLSDANISAFQINPDTYKYVGDVFAALGMRWAFPIDDHQFYIYYNYFLRYYGEEAAAWFARCRKWNEDAISAARQIPEATPVPTWQPKTDGQIFKIFLRKVLKYLLPYGLIRFVQTNRNKG